MKQPADYQFRRVTIDLGGGDIHQDNVSCQDLEDFLGGIGRSFKLLGAYEVTDAFAPSSPLIMNLGIFSGTEMMTGLRTFFSAYSPLKVAEVFRMLEALFPGRIDLGIGRAPGSDGLTAQALRADGTPERFPQQIADLLGFLHGTLPEGHPFAKIVAMPTGPTAPDVWLLGSSDQSAMMAAHFGVYFSFAHFINADGGADVTRAYRRQFRPSAQCPAPRSSAAVFVVCADTEAEAQRLAKSRELFIVRLYTGRPDRYPSVAEAESYPYSGRELAILHHARGRTVAGAPEQVRARLEALAADYEADELVIVTITHDPKARRRSYELLAQVFELEEPRP